MSSFGHLSTVVLVLAIAAGPASAQGDVPAEFPPTSFDGNQFVDSNGCAFIRAGIGGATNWVPRVSRQRQPLCNFQPTFPAGVAGPAQGRVAPLDAPIINITPPAAVAAAAPAPVQTRGVTAPIATVASIPAVRSAPTPAVPVAAPTPQIITPPPAAAPPRMTLAEACEGRFGIQPGFVSSRTGDPIDCGPAPQLASAAIAPTPAASQEPLRMTLAEVCAEVAASGTRFVRPDGTPIICDAPAAPIVAAIPAAPVADPVLSGSTCPGNPNLRGDPNLPMRCGPQSEKPYTLVSGGGVATSTASVSTSGFAGAASNVPASNPVVSTRSAPQPPKGYEEVWTDGRINPQRGQVVQAAPRVSTRSAIPAAVRAPAAMTHRYVQVGTFGDPNNAARMIERLAGMGFPVASAKSGSLKVIAAGPFSTPADLARALEAVRGLGFADAYTRN